MKQNRKLINVDDVIVTTDRPIGIAGFSGSLYRERELSHYHTYINKYRYNKFQNNRGRLPERHKCLSMLAACVTSIVQNYVIQIRNKKTYNKKS